MIKSALYIHTQWDLIKDPQKMQHRIDPLEGSKCSVLGITAFILSDYQTEAVGLFSDCVGQPKKNEPDQRT